MGSDGSCLTELALRDKEVYLPSEQVSDLVVLDRFKRIKIETGSDEVMRKRKVSIVFHFQKLS